MSAVPTCTEMPPTATGSVLGTFPTMVTVTFPSPCANPPAAMFRRRNSPHVASGDATDPTLVSAPVEGLIPHATWFAQTVSCEGMLVAGKSSHENVAAPD